MARSPSAITPAELATLRVLWERGPSTIRELTAALYPAGCAGYATVQKLLERLENKRAVRRKRAAPAHVFRVTLKRDTLIAQRLRELANDYCDGALAPLLAALAKELAQHTLPAQVDA